MGVWGRLRTQSGTELSTCQRTRGITLCQQQQLTVKNQYLSHHQPDIYDMKMVVVAGRRRTSLNVHLHVMLLKSDFMALSLAVVSWNAQQQQRTAQRASHHRRWVNKAENGIILFRFAFVLCCCCCTRARGVKSTATQQRRGNGKLCFSQIEFCWVLSLWWEEESGAVKISSVNKRKHCVRWRWKSSWTFPHEMIPVDAVLGWAESKRHENLGELCMEKAKAQQ